jgi:hypothetical protein
MTWTQHMSRQWNRPYWFNSETGKSVWILPEVEKKKMEDAKKTKAQSETPAPKPRDAVRRHIHQERDNEYQDYEVTNGFISTTIRARDRYEAMAEMRDIAQSLNPYD